MARRSVRLCMAPECSRPVVQRHARSVGIRTPSPIIAALDGDGAMGFLDGKRILVTGLLSATARSPTASRSAAAARARRSRSPTRTTASRSASPRWRRSSAATLVFPCDVASDEEIDRAVRGAGRSAGTASTASCTAIAFAPREALAGDFLDGLSREAFRIAHDVSELQLRRARQGRAAADAGAQGRVAHAHLPRRGARRAELQRDGARQGEPGSRRALPRARASGPRASASTASRRGRSRRSPRPASRASGRS